MPPNEAFVSDKSVKIKSWNAKENAYNEFEADYDTMLENLKSKKVGFLLKNLYGSDDEDESDNDSEKEQSLAPTKTSDMLGVPGKKQDHQNDSAITESKPKPIQLKISGGGSIKTPESLSAEAKLLVKGPKQKLTQLPRHGIDKDEDAEPDL